LLQFMKLLLAVIILLAFVYTYAYPSYNEHSGHNHPDHHFSKRSADENNESAEHKSSSTEEEGDVDPVNDTTSPDNELEEIVEEECSEDKSRNEEGTTGEAHTKLSLKDQQGVHKVGKRNANAEGHDHHGEERDGTREKRSQSEEDPSEDGHVAEHEDHSESSQQFEAVEALFPGSDETPVITLMKQTIRSKMMKNNITMRRDQVIRVVMIMFRKDTQMSMTIMKRNRHLPQMTFTK
uniref:Secreted phosphoprotein 1 n=1 Tax=Haemonchus contortus TaxID=6289 RepID=A0A7I4YQB9_HAECO